MAAQGLGISKCISLGADHLIGTSFVPVVNSLFSDKNTRAILLIGQVHGTLEQEFADFYRKKHPKKVFVYIPGRTLARSDKAPLLGMKSVLFSDVIQEKQKSLMKVKVGWIDSSDQIGKTIFEALKGRKK